MSKRTLVAALLVVNACLASAVACNEGGKPPVGPVIVPATLGENADGGRDAARVARSGAEIDHPEGGAAADAAPDFYACTTDKDCVAVPKVGCCPNGYKEALNAKFVDAYKSSFVCPTPNQICPHYMVNDMRVPECNQTQACELLEVKNVRCGGAGANPHDCPEGTRCVPGAGAGATGTCQK